MVRRTNSSDVGESAGQDTEGGGMVHSRDSVVESILQINADESELHSEEYQLRRLLQAIRNREGRFGLLFAVCNEPLNQKRLTEQIIANLPGERPVELQLNGGEVSLLDTLLTAPGDSEILIVYGIELLLPSADSHKVRREQTLQELQLRREQFRRLSRPVLIWMPEYVYSLIGQQAVDFWSWQSGGFFFESPKSIKADETVKRMSFRSPAFSHGLSSLIRNFTGHEQEVHRITTALSRGENVCISGIGGVGKTALAIHVAKLLIDDYPDGQLFIPLSPTERSLSDGLREAVQSLEPTANAPEDVAVLTSLYRSLLDGRRALIVVANAPNAASVRAFLPPANSSLLVTSRTGIKLPGLINVYLDQLSPAEAREMLLKLAPHVPMEIADQICAFCGYLPLAIHLAGSFLASAKEVDPADYLADLADESASSGSSPSGTAVGPVLNIIYSRLSPGAAKVFRRLGVFPGSFDATAEGAVCEDPNNESLNKLLKRELVFYDASSQRFNLHPLASQVAAAHLSAEEDHETRKRHAAHYLKVLWKADDLYNKGDFQSGIDLFDLEWANIQAGQAWAASHAEEDSEAASLCMDYPNAGAHLITLQRTPAEIIPWMESAIVAARLTNKRAVEIVHLGNIGNMYTMQGNTGRAIEYYEQALARAREVNDRRSEMLSLGSLGDSFYVRGDTERAIELHEQALSIARETADQKGEGHALSSLGVAYLRLGDTARAIRLHEQALEIARSSGELRNEGAELTHLGVSYATRGNARHAISFYEKSLEIAHKVGDVRLQSYVLGNIGSAYAALSDYRRAIQFYEQQLRVTRQLGDKDGEASALGNLGNAYKSLGEVRRAIEFHEQALSLSRSLGNHIGESYALGNLGNLYHLAGQSRRAIDFYEEALAISRKVGDLSHEAIALGSLGNAYSSLGDYHRALEFYQQELTIHREIGDRRHEASTLGNMGIVYDSLGDTKRAIEMHQEDLTIAREIGDRRGEGAALANLGNIHAESGDRARALEFYEQRLLLAREIGDRHGECSTLNNIGNIYASTNDFKRALPYYEQALAVSREVQDRRVEGHTLYNMSLALIGLRRQPEAIARAEAALKVLEEIEDPRAHIVRERLTRMRPSDPHAPVGYNIYCSTDPNLPKKDWIRLNDQPLPAPSFIDKAENRDPNSMYYYYMTSINASGLESAPSDVITMGSNPDKQ